MGHAGDPAPRMSESVIGYPGTAGAGIDTVVMQGAFLDHGANVRAAGRDGRNVLSLPATVRTGRVILLLFERGAPWKDVVFQGVPFKPYVEGQPVASDSTGLAEVLQFFRTASSAR